MIRVFPRRTKWTPDDDLVFVGDPPLFRPADDIPVMVSCTYTWDIEEAYRLQRSWSRYYSDVQVGGPAFDDPGGDFVPGRFVKDGMLITSRGCTKECEWCLVPRREGWIRELPIRDGYNLGDNNLLACSQKHIEAVFEMLSRQKHPAVFSGGLDAELFRPWHAGLLRQIRWKFAFFACDYPGAIRYIEQVADIIGDISREKKRCYVMIGYADESIAQAEKRLRQVYELGFLPFAMLYRGPEVLAKANHTRDWLKIQKLWARPAAYKAHMNQLTAEGAR